MGWQDDPVASQASAEPYARNQAYAKPAPAGGYGTRLAPAQEAQFQSWVKQNNVPFDPSPQADYDMRGFYKGLVSGDPHAQTGMNANDGKLHFSDYYKTPYHKSFSNESQWATAAAPRWNQQDQLVTPDGKVVFDERAQNQKPAWASDPIVGQPAVAPEQQTHSRGLALQPMPFAERMKALISGLNVAFPIATPVAETAAQMTTGAVAAPAAGLAGLASLPAGANKAADNTNAVAGALQYQPSTTGGQALSRMLGSPFEMLGKGADVSGEYVSQKTGSPLLGALTNTAMQAAPALLLRGRGRAAEVGGDVTRTPPVGRPPVRPEGAPPGEAPPAARPAGLDNVPAPTREELRTQSRAAYQRAEQAGVVIRGDTFERFQQNVDQMLQHEGVDATLHPSTTAAARRIAQERGPITLERLETLRRIVKDAEGAQAPADRRLANRIVDRIDDFADTLSERDLNAGTPEAVGALREARSLYARERKAATLDDLAERAQNVVGANYTQAGLETALRQQFRALANNPRRMRLFNPEERAAITLVVRGAPLENIVRMIGRLAPTGPVSSIPSFAATAAAGPIGLAVPVAGTAARYAATRMTLRNVQAANELVRRGPPGNALRNPARARQRVPD